MNDARRLLPEPDPLCIDDEPVRFYYRHRQQIEEWAALAEPAQGQARRVVDHLAQRVRDSLPSGAELLTGNDGPWERVAYYLPGWRAEQDALPRAAVGMGWNPKSVMFFGSTRPWIGVWRGERSPEDPLTLRIRAALAAERQADGGFSGFTDFPTWPLYRYLDEPSGDFWDKPTLWVESSRDALLRAWERLHVVVEKTPWVEPGQPVDPPPLRTDDDR